ncbi:MAG: hypothetical protein C4K48_05640 [Candidatus Thorarchaeota archaeon]|nr:MAG: hypothetical protein C4K48_05640 [Candidatus Thorarchaeota archaeon]
MDVKRAEILRLLSVTLTREKQLLLQEEFKRYATATNWVIKNILKNHLRGQARTRSRIEDEFLREFDERPVYLDNVVTSARAEVARHTKLAMAVVSMRDKMPFFKPGRLILSQPIITVGDKAVTLRLPDRTELPIPFDKRSRNRLSPKIDVILRGEPIRLNTSGIMPHNKRYERIRLTWHNEGFVDIDIRATLPEDDAGA